MVRTHLDRAVTAPSTGRQGHNAGATAILDQQIEREPTLEHRAGRAVGGVDEGPFHLCAGGGAARVHDRAAGSGPPRRASASRPVASRSNSTPRAISSWTRPGPSSTRTRTASSSQRPAPAASVSARCRSVESSSAPSTAATPPCAQRVADWDSAPLVSTPREREGEGPPGPASRTAADRPATPLPRTRTSKGPGGAPVVTPIRSV